MSLINSSNTFIPTGLWAAVLLAGLTHPAVAQSQSPDFHAKYGPSQVQLGDLAQIYVPEGFFFLDASDSRTMMRQLGNTASGKELGTIAKHDANWFIVFEYDDIGYVKDTDKDFLDAKAILASIQANNERTNEYRRERGMRTLEIIGWQQPPTYNPHTNNLEWCVRAKSQGQPVLNHNTRILGRSGVMQVSLVADPDQFETVSADATRIMKGFSYLPDQQYGQWRIGDRVADYGLTALVAGSTAAMMIRSGRIQKLIKPLLLALAFVGGITARFYRKFSFFGRAVPSPAG